MAHTGPSASEALEASLCVPPALDEPVSGRRFTPAEMHRKVRVLFMIQDPGITPAISVHADLIQFASTFMRSTTP